ncbi:aromatic-ring-hydroxylating dioxygenase subunit beta [Variovorax sp. RO1]|uniref:aromatic-ring-hydroxylating dioxygenase subunit beta n=1 Tax=Variovorax sp. RO1 TaxID=2066034 RepID=UPI000C718146|nr:aromatic-ring-hydroxylating dioxygenase subunit beta [Variovorax sp. RO1]PLC03348.1 aromatic-ring-hydroxylating dioxygenase subunit beta [Variovorax sp. RO1]
MNFRDWNEQQDLTQFLHHEARLLDEHRWDEWQKLFTPDGLYWVPLVHGQVDHLNHASLFCEDALLRSMRARRLEQARAYSQQPPTRTVHVLGNIALESRDDDATCTVRSTFLLLEWRKTEQRTFGGSVRHTLRRADDGWRIQTKRIDLVNCDAPHEALQVFL